MTDQTPTTTPQALAIVEGLRLLNASRSALAYVEHELSFLDDQGLPIVDDDELPNNLARALDHARTLTMALRRLVGYLQPAPVLNMDTALAVTEAANRLASVMAIDPDVLVQVMIGAIEGGTATGPQVVDLMHALSELAGRRDAADEARARDAIAPILASMVDPLLQIATAKSFGDGDLRMRLGMYLTHEATIAEAAAALLVARGLA